MEGRIKEFIRVTAAEGAGKWAEREVFRYLARPLCSLVTCYFVVPTLAAAASA